MAAGAALVTALSWGRWILLGEIAPDLRRLPDIVAWPAAAILWLALGACHVAHRSLVQSPPRLRVQLRAALAVGAIAALMLPFLSNDLFSVLAYTDLAWNSTVNPLTLRAPGLRASRFFHVVSPAWNWTPCVYGPLQLAFWAPALRSPCSISSLRPAMPRRGGSLSARVPTKGRCFSSSTVWRSADRGPIAYWPSRAARASLI